MLEELGKIGRREYVHRYSRENKLEDQAITSPFSEHISHLQIRCAVLEVREVASGQHHIQLPLNAQIPTYSYGCWDDLEKNFNSKWWSHTTWFCIPCSLHDTRKQGSPQKRKAMTYNWLAIHAISLRKSLLQGIVPTKDWRQILRDPKRTTAKEIKIK